MEQQQQGSSLGGFVAVVELDEPYTREKVKSALQKSRFQWDLIAPPKGNRAFALHSMAIEAGSLDCIVLLSESSVVINC